MAELTVYIPQAVWLSANRHCGVAGCDRPYRCKGYCNLHYRRSLKHGSPVPPARTEQDRFWEKVQRGADDECWPWTGAMRGDYGLFNIAPTTIGAHRYSYRIAYGDIPDGHVIDHKCRQPSCVNPRHLQAVTVMLNSQNHSGPTRASSSGVRGVWWDKTWQRWTGQVVTAGVHASIGHHLTLESAEKAIIELRNRLHVNNLLDRAGESA